MVNEKQLLMMAVVNVMAEMVIAVVCCWSILGLVSTPLPPKASQTNPTNHRHTAFAFPEADYDDGHYSTQIFHYLFINIASRPSELNRIEQHTTTNNNKQQTSNNNCLFHVNVNGGCRQMKNIFLFIFIFIYIYIYINYLYFHVAQHNIKYKRYM